ncbi:hypothetical protein L2E82_16171 [Cichorium intybus]|uniref:Uncharacterized protein n=1 Tax=Cichorium intybus TaxID=13427 RepID=A0ACB9F5Z9_CICIN|nr:hypothetical protein L2E82_16171 [Cichorium intybus]
MSLKNKTRSSIGNEIFYHHKFSNHAVLHLFNQAIVMNSMSTKTPKREDDVDMISELPDHILVFILSLSLRLSCSNDYAMPTIRRWINAAITRNVKLLELKVCPRNESKEIVLPHSLMTCSSLEVLSNYFVEALHLPVSFPNLKTLELTIDCLIVDSVIEFLKCLPDLESLHLIIQQWFLTSTYGDLDQDDRRRILTRRLKRVEFYEFDGEHEKLEKAAFLLEHGDALEEMVFSWSNEAKYHELSMETMKKVSKFHKASSSVKVITLLRPDIAIFSDNM